MVGEFPLTPTASPLLSWDPHHPSIGPPPTHPATCPSTYESTYPPTYPLPIPLPTYPFIYSPSSHLSTHALAITLSPALIDPFIHPHQLHPPLPHQLRHPSIYLSTIHRLPCIHLPICDSICTCISLSTESNILPTHPNSSTTSCSQASLYQLFTSSMAHPFSRLLC